jgi:ribosomal protein S18 acetylase RimI-like enzyme
MMFVRKALLTDSETIASCLLLAMEEIVYKLIGEEDSGKALAFMRYFVEKENNQYSWQNCWVVEEEGNVVAAINIYNGAQLHELRRPVIDYIKTRFNRHIIPEDETQPGEYYIDSLGVYPEHRCKGIGTYLLQFLIDEYVTRLNQTLGLLVDEENPTAKSLYEKLGFKSSGKKALLGKHLEHLQIIR